MITEPQTHKIHKMDWWLWKCNIISKVQTVLNILYIRAETRTKANLNPTSNETLLVAQPAPREHHLLSGALQNHFPKSTGEAEGLWLHPVQRTCIIGPISE